MILDDPPAEVPADLENLTDAAVDAVAVVDIATVLVSDGGDLWAIDPLGERTVLERAVEPVRAAAPWGEVWLLSTATDLLTWDGSVLSPTPLAEVVGPVDQARAHGDDLWLHNEDGLRLWRNGAVMALRVDDAEVDAFALGGDVRGNDVVWAAVDDVVHGIGNAGQVWVDLEAARFAGAVDSLAVDADRTAWAAAGGWLYRRDAADGWLRYDLGTTVWEVYGHPDAHGVWVEGDGTWWFTDGTTWESPQGLPAPSPSRVPTVDPAGRLLLADAAGLVRASTTRPLVLVGLAEGAVVARPAAVQLVPTAPDQVQSLAAELVDASGSRVPLPLDGDIVTVDPEGLASGPWTFVATADYGGRSSVSERSIFLGADFVPTWAADVQPLYEAECAVCHGGDAQTVLDEPEQWEAEIDDILFNVRQGNMPLGGDALSDLEVVVIEAWRDAGFPR